MLRGVLDTLGSQSAAARIARISLDAEITGARCPWRAHLTYTSKALVVLGLCQDVEPRAWSVHRRFGFLSRLVSGRQVVELSLKPGDHRLLMLGVCRRRILPFVDFRLERLDHSLLIARGDGIRTGGRNRRNRHGSYVAYRVGSNLPNWHSCRDSGEVRSSRYGLRQTASRSRSIR